MPSISKKIIIALVLASFLSVIFFSFAIMMQGAGGHMSESCPFSAMGVSLCPQDTLAVVVHHISSYHSFLNVIVYSDVMTLLVSLLLAAFAILVFFASPTLFGNPPLASVILDYQPVASRDRKITRWLSLFENSPSLF